jgi:hypothetical protein
MVEGAWGWFVVVVVQLVFNSVLGEDLLFRGLLLPRMRGLFERGDFVANGALFAFTICTNRGRSPPPWWRTSSSSPTPLGGGRAYSLSSSSSPSCSPDLLTSVTPTRQIIRPSAWKVSSQKCVSSGLHKMGSEPGGGHDMYLPLPRPITT